jgi:hypothetical protein
MNIVANGAEDNMSEYKQTEQSTKGNRNFLYDQFNLFRLKGITNEYQNTDINEAKEDYDEKNDSNKASILEDNNEDDLDEDVINKDADYNDNSYFRSRNED